MEHSIRGFFEKLPRSSAVYDIIKVEIVVKNKQSSGKPSAGHDMTDPGKVNE